VQEWYHCRTCVPASNLDAGGHGVCEPCALACHRGHALRYARNTRFKCDCGADISDVERLMGEQAGALGTSAGKCCRLKGAGSAAGANAADAGATPTPPTPRGARLTWGPSNEDGGGGSGGGGGGGRVGLSHTPLSWHWSCTNWVHTDMVT